MTLGLMSGVFLRPVLAQEAGLAAIADPPPLEPTSPVNVPVPPLADPDTAMDLPVTPASQIDPNAVFLHQGDGSPARNFSDQRFGYVLHGETSAAYESNIFIQNVNAQHDFIFTVAPGLALGWGDFKGELYGPDSFRYRFERYVGKNFIYADYSPSYSWFANHTEENGLQHDARLNGEWTHQKLTLGIRASYVTKNSPEADVGARVEIRRTDVALTSSYQYSGKTAFEVNAYYDSVDYDNNEVDSKEWRNQNWIAYQLSPKIKVGLGETVAHVERSVGPAQNYEQGLLRLQYVASEKLTIALSGGVEFRQTDGGVDRTFGTFSLNAVWAPADGTYIYVQGYRSANVSGALGEDYFVGTGVQVQFRQRILQKFYFNLGVGYQNSDYQSSSGSPDFGRNDNLFFVRPGLGFDLATWLNCELTGEYRKNDSTITQRQFDATTAMVKFSALF